MDTQPIIRVMLVEDDKALRDTHFEVMNGAAHFICVAACADAETAIPMMRSTRPDVVLMDIELGPGKMNGINATASIKAENSKCLVLIHTVMDQDDKILKAILAGADGYIVKGISNERLLESIDKVVEGDFPMSPGLARRIKDMLAKKKASATLRFLKGKALPDDLALTPIEALILDKLIENVPRKIIADQLNMKMDALKWHIKEIYRKIRARGEGGHSSKDG